MSRHCDVAVIGAGIAGLCAARLLAEAGQHVVVLEARDRVGGRILTAQSTGGMPVELGAEFVHGEPQPTLDLAREAGLTLSPLHGRHYVKHGFGFRESPDPVQPLAHLLEQCKQSEPDSSAQAFLEQHQVAPKTAERFRQLVEGFEAAPIAEVSIQSLAEDLTSRAASEKQFRIREGYGMLVEHAHRSALRARAEVLVSCAVTRVSWAENGPVALQFATGRPDLEARRCLITAPLGVLQAAPEDHGLCFDPPLTEWMPSLARLAMGHAHRVVFSFSGRLALEGVPPDGFIHNPVSLYETFWAQHTQSHTLWTAWAGGPKASELARENAEQRQRLALGALAALFDLPETRLEATLLGVHQHDFSNDPRARGAYSFCRPGGAKAARSLQIPVGNALFLAGEVTADRYPGTVAGAIASGQRAARQVLDSLR